MFAAICGVVAGSGKNTDTPSAVCDKVRIFPRAGLVNRINGCRVQGSNTSFTADMTDLAVISGFVDGWNEITFANSTAYQYLRIESNGVIQAPAAAEIEFYSGAVLLSPAEIQASSEYSPALAKENAFDADTGTEYDNAGGTGNWIGVRI
jgi:hypothetical protein